MTTSKRAKIEFYVARLAMTERVSIGDPRIREARRDAILYTSEGMSPKEAVESAAVLVFRRYGQERR